MSPSQVCKVSTSAPRSPLRSMRVNTDLELEALTIPLGARGATIAAPPEVAQAAAAGTSTQASTTSATSRQREVESPSGSRPAPAWGDLTLHIVLGWNRPVGGKQEIPSGAKLQNACRLRG